MQAHRLISVAVLGLLCCADVARGQFGEANDYGSISGSGAVTLTRKPEVMRLQIIVQAKGKIIKEALFRLKSRLDNAREEVEKLGAEKDSIQVAETRIVPPESNSQRRQMQRQLRMMMAQQADANEKAEEEAPKNKLPPPIVVAALLSAEWKLTANPGDELLMAVHALQEKIKAADLAGAKKDMEEVRAEVPVAEEDIEEMMDQFSNSGEAKPGEPLFLFACPISEEEYNTALAEAFQKATKDATRLANAAGARLGKLRSLHRTNSFDYDMENYGFNGHNMAVYRARQLVQRVQNEMQINTPHKFEAIGVEPALIKYVINVTASFDLGARN